MNTSYYIISLNSSNGISGYLSETGSFVEDVSKAFKFAADFDKVAIIDWVDKTTATTATKQNIDKDSIRIHTLDIKISPIDLENDSEWRTALQRHGVYKLSPLEIMALDLTKYELERRMSI